MPAKDFKPIAGSQKDQPAPLSSAGFSEETLAAIERSAKQLKEVPARAYSKLEIQQLFKKIRDHS